MEVKGVRAKSGHACSTAGARAGRGTSTSAATTPAAALTDRAIGNAHTNSSDAEVPEAYPRSVDDEASVMPVHLTDAEVASKIRTIYFCDHGHCDRMAICVAYLN